MFVYKTYIYAFVVKTSMQPPGAWNSSDGCFGRDLWWAALPLRFAFRTLLPSFAGFGFLLEFH